MESLTGDSPRTGETSASEFYLVHRKPLFLHKWGSDTWALQSNRGCQEDHNGSGQSEEDTMWVLLCRVSFFLWQWVLAIHILCVSIISVGNYSSPFYMVIGVFNRILCLSLPMLPPLPSISTQIGCISLPIPVYQPVHPTHPLPSPVFLLWLYINKSLYLLIPFGSLYCSDFKGSFQIMWTFLNIFCYQLCFFVPGFSF